MKFKATGTEWIVDFKNGELENKLKEQILETVKLFEESYSRFLEKSLVSKLNKEKKLLNPPLEMIKMMLFGKELNEFSKGNFDMLIAHKLEDIGYGYGYGYGENEVTEDNTNFINSKNELVITESLIKIPYPLKLDLGGIGKGYLVDKIYNLIVSEYSDAEFTINAGGDIRNKSKSPVSFKLENPFNENEFIGEYLISTGAIASSSPFKRSWNNPKTNKKVSHIIGLNPDIAGVFTVGENSFITDSLATTLLVLNPTLWGKLRKKYGVEFLIVFTDKSTIKSKGFKLNRIIANRIFP